ncbi:MAG TPA: phosphoribosylaminoimidazolesuccinocarboxamide synthase [Oligoflexia bacterium]|nr:phosphoribosylaminoimidazolesuccinocarboxamide synthase [Oligoflexia bacterium]HMP47384.1 phosphoribosylaminoimidazolesuccinocarboxamide synthase [Oligoflexia bacterium]
MLSKDFLNSRLCSSHISIDLPGLGNKISGKVRDCYVLGNKRVLISSDRLSAFDVVLSTIPGKGKLLNDLTDYWFKKTAHIIPNHILKRPHPNVFIARELNIVPIEVVVRGYLAGGGWREYQSTGTVSGVRLKSGLKKYEKLDSPIITPSTKEAHGAHDKPVSRDEILKWGILEESLWIEIEKAALSLYSFAHELTLKQGLLFMDTKYEFGILHSENDPPKLLLADEIHTQDSSRYAISDSYESRMGRGEEVELLDKEFLRVWLISQGWQGEGKPPVLQPELRVEIAQTYIRAFEKITGETFSFSDEPIVESTIIDSISGL